MWPSSFRSFFENRRPSRAPRCALTVVHGLEWGWAPMGRRWAVELWNAPEHQGSMGVSYIVQRGA